VPSRLRTSLTARPVDAAVTLGRFAAADRADAVVAVGLGGATPAPSAADLAVAVGLAGLTPADTGGAIAVGSDGTAAAAEASLILSLGLTDPTPAAADAALSVDLGVDDATPAGADAALSVDLGVDDATPAGAADAALTVDLGMDDGAPADATDAALAVDLGVGDTTPAAAEADVTLGLSGFGDLAPAVDAPTLPALPALPDPPALPGAISSDGLLGDVPGIGVDVDDLVPPTVCFGCGQDTSTGGTSAPTPGSNRDRPDRHQRRGAWPNRDHHHTPGGTLPFTGDALDLLAI
jgi:hypothetical protein